MWRLTLVCFAVSRCGSVEVTVGEERKFAPLFEEVVLRCQYSSSSSQTPVVQWWYKSYCRDRTRDSFPRHCLQLPELLPPDCSDSAKPPIAIRGSSHLDCSDSARTVLFIFIFSI
ncbi:hypothetical protein AAFF_G00308560 [Aldrovandia affinis]|uniref:Secreted protein n=1 Tax=Aldrovandia affinis TaxID=143900 RepID=A0AAD7SP10_9TELE|nr:hypothetical protein AAFF_G00308560 [Aldrovandia affinis]